MTREDCIGIGIGIGIQKGKSGRTNHGNLVMKSHGPVRSVATWGICVLRTEYNCALGDPNVGIAIAMDRHP